MSKGPEVGENMTYLKDWVESNCTDKGEKQKVANKCKVMDSLAKCVRKCGLYLHGQCGWIVFLAGKFAHSSYRWRQPPHLSVWGHSLATTVSLAIAHIQSGMQFQGVNVQGVTFNSRGWELKNEYFSFPVPLYISSEVSSIQCLRGSPRRLSPSGQQG